MCNPLAWFGFVFTISMLDRVYPQSDLEELSFIVYLQHTICRLNKLFTCIIYKKKII